MSLQGNQECLIVEADDLTNLCLLFQLYTANRLELVGGIMYFYLAIWQASKEQWIIHVEAEVDNLIF